MLMSGLYFVHRLHSPHLNGVGKAAISAASWVNTWQGPGNSTLTVLRIAARDVRWILFAREQTYRGSRSCEMFADVLCVRGQLWQKAARCSEETAIGGRCGRRTKQASFNVWVLLVENACDHCAPSATSQNTRPYSCAHASNIGGLAVQQQ